jgi:hypothetical protein
VTNLILILVFIQLKRFDGVLWYTDRCSPNHHKYALTCKLAAGGAKTEHKKFKKKDCGGWLKWYFYVSPKTFLGMINYLEEAQLTLFLSRITSRQTKLYILQMRDMQCTLYQRGVDISICLTQLNCQELLWSIPVSSEWALKELYALAEWEGTKTLALSSDDQLNELSLLTCPTHLTSFAAIQIQRKWLDRFVLWK